MRRFAARAFAALRFAFRWTRRFAVLLVFAGMLLFNGLTLAWGPLNAAAGKALSAVGG